MTQHDYDCLVADLKLHQTRVTALKSEVSMTQNLINSYEKIIQSIQTELKGIGKAQLAKFQKTLVEKQEASKKQTLDNEKFKKAQKAERVAAEAKSTEKAAARKPRAPRKVAKKKIAKKK